MAVFTGKLTPPDAQDSFIGADTEADTFRFTPLTLEAGDTVIGGGGAFDDILQFTASGAIDSARFAGVSGIEEIRHAAGGNSCALTEALVASSRAGSLVIRGGSGTDSVDGSAVLNPALTLSFLSNGGADTLIGGAGADRFTIAAAFAGARSITGNGGDDVLTTNPLAWSGTDIFAGGAGTDRIVFSDTGSVTAAQLAGLSSVEEIQINGVFAFGLALNNAAIAQAGGTLTVISTGAAAGHAVDASAVTSGSVVFKAGNGADSFLGGAGDDTYETSDALATGNLGAGDDTLKLNTIGASGLVVDGGAGFDTIVLAIGSVLDLSGATNFEEVELIKATTLTLATTPGMRVLGSAFKDTVTLGGPGQTFFGFAGDDTVRITAASLLGAVLNGGTQTAVDTLRMITPGTYDFRRAAVTGFERYELDTAPVGSSSNIKLSNQALDLVLRHAATVTMGTNAAQTVLGSSRADNIFLGAAGQFVEAGGGNDQIYATPAMLVTGTVISGGAGTNDRLVVTTGGTVDLATGALVLGVERITWLAGTDLTLDDAPDMRLLGSSANDTVTAGGDGTWGELDFGDDVLRVGEFQLGATSPNLMQGGNGTDSLVVLDQPTTPSAIIVPARFVGFEILDLSALSNLTVQVLGNTDWTIQYGVLPLTVLGGSGNETFHLSNGTQIAQGGLGNDTFILGGSVNINASQVIKGDDGTDEINIALISGANISMPNGWQVEIVRLSGSRTFTANTLAGLTIIGDPTQQNIMLLNGNGQSAQGGSGADTLRVQSGANTTLAGGDGADTYIIRPGDPWTTLGQTIQDNATFGNLNDIVFDSPGTVQIDFNQHAVSHIDRMLVTAAAAQVNLTISNAMASTADGSNGGSPGDLFIFASVAVTAGATINGSGLLSPNLLRFAGISGGAFNGADTVSGGAGADFMISGDGSDSLSGNDGNDTLQGEDDNDTLQGNAGDDSLLGGSGNDSLVAGAGGDTMLGGSGADRIALGAVDTASDRLRYTGSTDGSPDLNDATSVTESAADLVIGFDPSLDRIELSRSGLGLGAGGVVNVAANGIWNIGTGAVFLFESDSTNNDVLMTLAGAGGNNFADLDQIARAVNVDNGAGTGSSAGRTVALVVSNDTGFAPRRTGIYVWSDTDGNSDVDAGDVIQLLAVLEGVTANQLAASGAILIA